MRLHVQYNSQNVNTFISKIHQPLKHNIMLSCIFFTLLSLSYCKVFLIDFISVPIPSLEVTLSRQCDLLAGSNLTLTCDITVDPNVDTPFDVNVSWNMTDQLVISSGNTGRERCGGDREQLQ